MNCIQYGDTMAQKEVITRMKKFIALFFALLLAISFGGCAENAVLEESRVYQVESDIHSLEIRVGAADFTIKQAEKFSVESNLKYLTVSEEDGVLSIIEETKKGVNYEGPVLTLYMPTDMMYETINISTGAGKLTADALSTKSLKFQLGAGDAYISSLSAQSEADIEGGAGKITIDGGTMSNLELEMGVGELNLTAVLLGNNDLTFGVGETNLTLLGSRDNYTIDMEKGLGSIAVDGKFVSDLDSIGNGHNHVQMHGGVGSINLKFQETKGV